MLGTYDDVRFVLLVRAAFRHGRGITRFRNERGRRQFFVTEFFGFRHRYGRVVALTGGANVGALSTCNRMNSPWPFLGWVVGFDLWTEWVNLMMVIIGVAWVTILALCGRGEGIGC